MDWKRLLVYITGKGSYGAAGQYGGQGGDPGRRAWDHDAGNLYGAMDDTERDDASNGGRGIKGEDGGRGGPGDGGAGGPSIGILKKDSAPTVRHATIEVGNGGAGGNSSGNHGETGLSRDTYVAP